MAKKQQDDFDYALTECRRAAKDKQLTAVGNAVGLDYSWLTKFTRGTIPGASYVRVRKLAEHFRANPRRST